MPRRRLRIGGILTTILVIALLIIVGFTRVKLSAPIEVYKVYINGKSIGMIKDADELYSLIDNKQNDIKTTYKVDKVYPPSGLEVTKYLTYDDNLYTADDIYKLIEFNNPFTIQGYTLTIKPEEGETKQINVLHEEDIEPALMDAVGAFITPEKLKSYINDTQIEVTETGKTIESVYFEEKMTVKETYLPVNSDIITNKSDLTKYLLFGTLKKQAEYTVKNGDTVETIAFNNKLSPEELLIANPNLSSVNSLLSNGQILNIGLINPMFTVIEESEVIEDIEDATIKTIYEEDNTRYASQTYVKQEGKKGINRVTEKKQYKNGVVMAVVFTNTEELVAPVNKIIVKGTKPAQNYSYNNYPPAASSTDWGWPTPSPYTITSYYGYRWGRLHGGIDISTGYRIGTAIYSATDGEVISINNTCANIGYYGNNCGGQFGNSVRIKADTGSDAVLEVYYAHMMKNIKVKPGQKVTKGQLLGYMGASGSSTGTHLHFEIRDANGNKLNPCKVAFKC